MVVRSDTAWLHARLTCANLPFRVFRVGSYGVYDDVAVSMRSRFTMLPSYRDAWPTLTYRMPWVPADAPTAGWGPIPPRSLNRISVPENTNPTPWPMHGYSGGGGGFGG